MEGYTLGVDNSLQTVFNRHDEDDHRDRNGIEQLLMLFTCASTFGVIFVPNLVMETLHYGNENGTEDSFLVERYIFVVAFTVPYLIALFGIYEGYEHTAYLYTAFTSIKFVAFGYITDRILARSSYTKVWTLKVRMFVYVTNCIVTSFVLPFGHNLSMKKIVSSLAAIIVMCYHVKYLKNVNNLRQLLLSNDGKEWIESIVVYISLGNVCGIILRVIRGLVYGGMRHDMDFSRVRANVSIEIVMFVVLSCILNTIPRTNLVISQAKGAFLKQFIRQMCHEIRTPLSIAQMSFDTIQEMIPSLKDIVQKSFYSEIEELVRESIEAIDISVELLNETLQLDKIESGSLEVERSHVSVGEFIRKAVDIFYGKCVSKQIYFDRNIYNDSLISRTIVDIDESKMAQVLRNFMSNAIKFTPEGGTITVCANTFYKRDSDSDNKIQPVDIEMSVDIPFHNFVRVEVVDTGIGIAAENVSKLFNQVIQIDAQRNQNGGGSGFGLLIAKKIVGMHDGYIGMSSNGLGEGSCFYFEIPIVEILPEASHPHSTEWSSSFGLEASNIEKMNEIPEQEMRTVQEVESDTIENKKNDTLCKPVVLIVEDAKMCAKLVAKSLRKCNVDSNCVYNGKEALDEVKEDVSKYSLILMDNRMPVMNGGDATEKIRQLGYENPIIGLTGDVLEEDVQVFLHKGANEVLSKPVKFKDLQGLLIRHKII